MSGFSLGLGLGLGRGVVSDANSDLPIPPAGFSLLKGADGAYLKGADGAYLYGRAT